MRRSELSKNRELAFEYLEEIENMLIRIERTKEFDYVDVMAALRSCYWLFKEYLRLEQRYDDALRKLKEKS